MSWLRFRTLPCYEDYHKWKWVEIIPLKTLTQKTAIWFFSYVSDNFAVVFAPYTEAPYTPDTYWDEWPKCFMEEIDGHEFGITNDILHSSKVLYDIAGSF